MEALVIHSKSRSNARLMSALARKLGDRVFENVGKTDKTEIHYIFISIFYILIL